MSRLRGFTLIELLVVVSIIALLVAILMPALNVARQQAMGVVCLTNQKSLMTCWIMYAGDNEDRMVNAKPGNYYDDEFDRWVMNVWSYSGVPGYDEDSMEWRHRAVEDGVFFKYIDNVEVIHCPGDRREFDGTGQFAFRTYSIGAGANGEDPGTPGICYNQLYVLKKTTEIKFPSEKYIMIEEWDPRGTNDNTWDIDPRTNDTNSLPVCNTWGDNPGFWHNMKGTLGFSDGHAEMRTWVNETTLDIYREQRHWGWYAENGVNMNGWVTIEEGENEDLRYMQRNYAYKGFSD